MKNFKKTVTFYDKNLKEFRVEFQFENNYCGNKPPCDKHFGIHGKYEMKPVGKFQKQILELEKKYCGWITENSEKEHPENLEELVDNCIKGIEENNIKNILKNKEKNLEKVNKILEEKSTYEFNYFDKLTKNVVDSRDLQERIEILDLLKILKEANEENLQELKQLLEFKEECSYSYGDNFENYKTIIHENYFEEYAKELAGDIGYYDDNHSNPLLNHIDWESWAKDIKVDYIKVEYKNETYYVR